MHALFHNPPSSLIEDYKKTEQQSENSAAQHINLVNPPGFEPGTPTLKVLSLLDLLKASPAAQLLKATC